jgi:Fe-S-cluster containining protein
METENEMAGIAPVRLGLQSRFRFDCRKDLACFTQCCRGIKIILTPYDILRLKKRLGLSSEQFLAIYTEAQILEKTDLPVVVLKLLDDAQDACPFVRDEGCIVYEDRPTTCRYYPLGMASLVHKEPGDDAGFYFFVNEPHCLGFDQEREWTVAQWRRDQGVEDCDDINAEWTDLIVRKRSFPPNIQLTEESKRMFFLVSYNLDSFRRFVFESTFLDRYTIEASVLEQIRKDEVALLKFGLRWLRSVLFKDGLYKPKQD